VLAGLLAAGTAYAKHECNGNGNFTKGEIKVKTMDLDGPNQPTACFPALPGGHQSAGSTYNDLLFGNIPEFTSSKAEKNEYASDYLRVKYQLLKDVGACINTGDVSYEKDKVKNNITCSGEKMNLIIRDIRTAQAVDLKWGGVITSPDAKLVTVSRQDRYNAFFENSMLRKLGILGISCFGMAPETDAFPGIAPSCKLQPQDGVRKRLADVAKKVPTMTAQEMKDWDKKHDGQMGGDMLPGPTKVRGPASAGENEVQ
jgi:hypothetical protein